LYINYNDYELLYLINDGNEKALNVLFDKYDYLIRAIAKEYAPYGSRSNDLAQELRMTLFDCVKCYKDNYNVSFYSYFLISVNRKAKRIIKNDYYQKDVVLGESIISKLDNSYQVKSIILMEINNLIKNKYNDSLSKKLIYDCLIGGKPLKQYALENNLNYNNLFYKYKKLCNDIKETIKKNTLLDLDKSLL